MVDWNQIVNQEIESIYGQWHGNEGAYYESLIFELENGTLLNLDDFEENINTKSKHIRPIREFSQDLKEQPSLYKYKGKKLKNIIYYETQSGKQVYLVTEDNYYITEYFSFNYTNFIIDKFSNWTDSSQSAVYWGKLQLKEENFYNLWTDERINPFALYK